MLEVGKPSPMAAWAGHDPKSQLMVSPRHTQTCHAIQVTTGPLLGQKYLVDLEDLTFIMDLLKIF